MADKKNKGTVILKLDENKLVFRVRFPRSVSVPTNSTRKPNVISFRSKLTISPRTSGRQFAKLIFPIQRKSIFLNLFAKGPTLPILTSI